MTQPDLTRLKAPASPCAVWRVRARMTMNRRISVALLLVAGTAALGGCINVAAPDEPIVIELNINIRQEVIYRLAEDAATTIEENADIF